MPNFAERQMFKLMGIESKEALQIWTVKHVQARKTLLKIIEHFETHETLTKEDFDALAGETFKTIKEEALKIAEVAKTKKL